MHQVLARKYRPRQFTEVIGQPHVVQALSNALDQQYLHHAYLFTGTRGVGKTTLARIVAKCLNCEQGISANPCGSCPTCQEIDSGRFPDLFEVDAASRTKVEDTRELLDNAQYAPAKGRYKIYLIDEVHMLSGHSFNALLKTLEEPPEHVKFLLATTDPQKLPATVLSRCLQFHLSTMPTEQIAAHLQTILNQEQIGFENPALELIAKAAQGSMRDALSLLDQGIAYSNSKVDTAQIQAMLGTIEPTALYDIMHALISNDANALLAASEKLAIQGADYQHALADLLSLLHQIAVAQFITIEVADTKITHLATQASREDIQLYYQIGLIGQRDLPLAPSPRQSFEMTLLRMLAFTPHTTNRAAKPKQATDNKKTAATNETATSHSPQATSWDSLLPNLKLSGMSAALAQQLSPIELGDKEYKFHLSPKQQPLYQPQYIKRIETALQEHFNKPIKLIIELGSTEVANPAQLEEQRQSNRQQQAEQSIMNDHGVKKLMNAFDATVIKESIAPTDPEKVN